MKLLIIGGGGREHALAWKVAQSSIVDEVLVAPGNAGTADEAKVRNIEIAADDIGALVAFAKREAIDLTIVGPEQPLVAGVVDEFAAAGLKCFGPRAAAARLEGSKAFAKAFMERNGIPTAAYGTFDNLREAKRFVQAQGAPIVIKADGLAAGKGVVVARSIDEAEHALEVMLEAREFGDAGSTVVIEQLLTGEEASFIALIDGRRILPMASSQDHKARDDGDTGPNTGGMGAYSPAPIVDDAIHERIMRDIMVPTVDALAADGIMYRGFLYAGLMIGADRQPRVLEFNCRLGDPETQPVLFRLQSDLAELCARSFDGTLSGAELRWHPQTAVGVVMASRGYPGSYQTGDEIVGLQDIVDPHVKVFHAGTRRAAGKTLTAGGRVLCVVAQGDDVASARSSAYAAVKKISWEGAFWRSDIGHRALQRG
jgi:phosphoribosylamine--glycine ligase